MGRDSISMLCLVVERALEVEGLGVVGPEDLDAVVFSDTGAEWQHTYEVLPAVRRLCEEHGIRLVVLAKGGDEAARSRVPTSWSEVEDKAADGGYHIRPGVMEDYQSRATVASLGKGDCTDNHKIQAIRRFLADVSVLRFGLNNREWSARVRRGEREPHVTIIGIAADETSRLEHGAGRGPVYVTERYPLVTMGVAKSDEAPILARHQLARVRKSGCVCCPYQPASWYWALSVVDPGRWAAVVEYERIALERNPRMSVTGIKGRGGAPMTLPEVVVRWRSANPAATVDAVLDKQYGRCLCEARAARQADEAALAAGGVR